MKSFQVLMLIVVMLSLVGVLAAPHDKYRCVVLFSAAGILYLAAWTLSKIYF